MKKAHHIILATALAAIAFNGVFAESKLSENKLPGNKKIVKSQPAATTAPAATSTTQATAASNNEQKIAEMQKAIDQLRAEINNITTARSDLQVKLEQSDKDVAAQMMKVEDIKKKLIEKQKEAEALAKEKKR
jgi:predicted RNase H-like nuclease (RuvC/YqgF family)